MISARAPALSNIHASVVVPAYNEGTELIANLCTLVDFLETRGAPYDYEIVVVDDGSSDSTYDAAQSVAARYHNMRVIRHLRNRGLGSAIRTGFAFAEGEIVVVYDSDLSYHPEIIPRLLAQMHAGEDDLVLASPYMRGGKVTNVPFLRRLLSREANRFLSFATNGRYATLTCMVRAYRSAFFKHVESSEERMEINPELIFKALRSGARISEIPAELCWSSRRARSRARMNLKSTLRQITRTMRYGIDYRPAVLLALPGILPGVLPLIVATSYLLHLNLRTIAAITLVTVIIQNASLALFAGQLAIFGRNVLRGPRLNDR